MPARKNRPDKRRMTTPATPARRTAVLVTDLADVRDLVAHLLGDGRTRPTVVISTSSSASAPYIDPATVTAEVADVADVFVFADNEITRTFADEMPPMTQVYGGAGRVYPVDPAWQSHYWLSPLRFAYDQAEGARAGRQLVEDAMAVANQSSTFQTATSAPSRVTGVVSALYPPTRAVVRLADGALATVWQERTVPGLAMDRVLQIGQHVDGMLDEAAGRLDIAPSLRDTDSLLDGYVAGAVVLVVVTDLTADVATLALVPDVVVRLGRADVTSNALDPLDELFSVGEVLPARIVRRTGRTFELQLDDVEGTEALPAPALMAGGPAWISAAGRQTATDVGDAPTREGDDSAAPTDRPEEVRADPQPRVRGAVRSLSLSLDEARAQVRDLEERLNSALESCESLSAERRSLITERDRAEAEVDTLQHQVALDRTKRRHAAVKAREAFKSQRSARQSQADAPIDDDDAFLDPEDQFRHEVYLAWARRIPKTDKAAHPLGDYRIGPAFLQSIDAASADRTKVVDVVVEVVTGLATTLDSREVHVLRSGEGAGSRAVTREDGATCWRASLQRSAPSARRLHYWRSGTETELSRVVLHDDFAP